MAWFGGDDDPHFEAARESAEEWARARDAKTCDTEILCPVCGKNDVEPESVWCNTCKQWVEGVSPMNLLHQTLYDIVAARKAENCEDLEAVILFINGLQEPLFRILKKARQSYDEKE